MYNPHICSLHFTSGQLHANPLCYRWRHNDLFILFINFCNLVM